MRLMILALVALTTGPALGQGLSIPGLGGGQGGSAADALQGAFGQQTPEQRRAFCTRVGQAAMRCGLSLDMSALSACLVRTLPPQDSARAARVINVSRGSPGALLSECGVTMGR